MKFSAAVCLLLVAMATVDAYYFGGFPGFPGRFPGMLHPGIGFPHPFLPRFGPFGFPRVFPPSFGPIVQPGFGVHPEPSFGARAEPSIAEPSAALAEPAMGVPEPFGGVPYYRK